jgi:nucleotide-binding universal stress UspA family protein
MYKHILVAIDGSQTSQRGLEEAILLARALGSSLRLVHVVNKTPWVSPDVGQSVLQHLIDDLRATGECILHDAASAARAAGLQADCRLIEALGDRAGEYVIQEALSWPAELIVCGTHGRRGMRRLLVGSDAEYIVRSSPVPVLLIRMQ